MRHVLRLLTLLYLGWASSASVHAQSFFDVVPQPTKSPQKITTPARPAPAPSSANCVPTYSLSVNVHFILTADSKGNFTETDDGGSDNAADWNTAGQWDTPSNPGGALPHLNADPNYNGYQFAQDIINAANAQWQTNPQMQLPFNNNTPHPDKGISFTLKGVYFHRDSVLYKYDPVNLSAPHSGVYSTEQFDTYGVNKSNEINIFLMGQATSPGLSPSAGQWLYGTGVAANIGYTANANWIKIGNPWRIYLINRLRNNVGAVPGAMASIVNHEVGHLLGLNHPFQGGNGCADTPTNSSAGAGNNLMDYGWQIALTPCQVDIAQNTITSYYTGYFNCKAPFEPWHYTGNTANSIYRIVNKHSGKVLDIAHASTAAGAAAIQWPYDPATPNQFWQIVRAGHGYYQLIAQHSGQALGIVGGVSATNTGPTAEQQPYAATLNQQWRIESVGNGAYRLIARHSEQALEVGGASTADGAAVNQWPYFGNDNQQWYIEDIGRYKLTGFQSGKVLDIAHASTAPGAAAIQWPYDPATPNQFWQIASVDNGAFKLVAQHSGQALEIGGSSSNNGATANQWPYNATPNQQWRIENTNTGNGTYRLIAQHSGQALEVGGYSTADGATINQWPYVGGPNQQWYIEQIGGTANRPAVKSTTTLAQVASLSASANPRQLLLYPNPTRDKLTVTFSDAKTLTSLRITDLSGHEAARVQYGSGGQLDVSALASGIYIVVANDGTQVYHSKFSKE